MKNNYISFYMPSHVYIPFDSLEKLTLRKNKVVYCGELLGCMSDGSGIYSTVSGIIKGAQKIIVENKMTDTLVIENDYKDKRFKLNGGKERIDLYKRKEANELLETFNLGGKYNGKKNLSVNLLISNDDLENRYILMEKTYEILETIDALLTIYSLESAYIAVNNKECIEYLEMYSGMYPNIKFTNRIKKDEKTVIYTGSDILNIYYVLKCNKKLCEKFITVIQKKQSTVFKVKLNMLTKELLDNLGIKYSNITVVNYNNEKIINYDGVITGDIKSIIVI